MKKEWNAPELEELDFTETAQGGTTFTNVDGIYEDTIWGTIFTSS